MKRNRIKHCADVACRMFIGWRMYADLEILAELPDGTVQINLLNGDTSHSATGKIDLNVTFEIMAWLKSEAEKNLIDLNQISVATLVVGIRTDIVETIRKNVVCFSFDCLSTFVTSDRTYSVRVVEDHSYHHRKAKP